MAAGEAGADYLMFGCGAEPHAQIVERVAWWAEIFTVPCVGYAHNLGAIGDLVRAGADFIALGDAVFADPRGAAAALRDAARLIAPRRKRPNDRGHGNRVLRLCAGFAAHGRFCTAVSSLRKPPRRRRSRPTPSATPSNPPPATDPLPVPARLGGAPDIAFAAYQRGYYVTAMREAMKRIDADPGDGPAMTLIGELYAQGLGVRRRRHGSGPLVQARCRTLRPPGHLCARDRQA